MEKEDDLPIIDWEACIKILGKREQAKEMLNLLIERLPTDISTIHKLYHQKQYADLWQQIHKLRGALCYIPLPRLRHVVDKLESNLKNNIMDGLPHLLSKLDNEVKLVIKEKVIQ